LDGSWQLLQYARPFQHEEHKRDCPPSPPQHQDYLKMPPNPIDANTSITPMDEALVVNLMTFQI
jgi:hypothetical protein